MKALFKGGPWNGCEMDFPTLPQWISLGKMLWDDSAGKFDAAETRVLASPENFLYLLRKVGNELYYELRILEGD